MLDGHSAQSHCMKDLAVLAELLLHVQEESGGGDGHCWVLLLDVGRLGDDDDADLQLDTHVDMMMDE